MTRIITPTIGCLLFAISAMGHAAGAGKGNSTGLDIPNQGVPACVVSNGKAPSKNKHCTADDDGDGVANYLDLCPTIPGSPIDGCPRVTLGTDLVAGPGRGFNYTGADDLNVILGDGLGGVASNTTLQSGGWFANETRTLDFNADGYDDFIVLFQGDNRNCLANNRPMLRAFINDGTGNFTGMPFINLGITGECGTIINSWAWDFTTADFNDDGMADFAVTRAHHISVVLGDGLGGALAQQDIPAAGPRNVTYGDFDNDGDMDIVANQANSGGGFYYLSNDGLGNFSAAVGFGVGELPIGAVAGDFDNDGNLDIASGGYSNFNLAIFWGDGAGGFSVPTRYNRWGAGAQLADDLDDDGDIDVLVVGHNGGAPIISVYHNDGAGNFTPDDYQLLQPIPVSYNPDEIVVVDFNEDGIKDLAFSNFASGSFSIRVMFGTGNGLFGSPVDINMGSRHVFNLASGNFD